MICFGMPETGLIIRRFAGYVCKLLQAELNPFEKPCLIPLYSSLHLSPLTSHTYFVSPALCDLLFWFCFEEGSADTQGVPGDQPLHTSFPRNNTAANYSSPKTQAKKIVVKKRDLKISVVFHQGIQGRVKVRGCMEEEAHPLSALWVMTSISRSAGTWQCNSTWRFVPAAVEVDAYHVPSVLSLKMEFKLLFGNLYSQCVPVGLKWCFPTNLLLVTQSVIVHVLLCCKENLSTSGGASFSPGS